GGNDAYIVCNDADLHVTVEACVKARTINSGQSCIAAKRFLVHEDIADEFIRLVAQRFDDMIVGDPMDLATEIGPMARADLRDTLLEQVLAALQQGASLATKKSIGGVLDEGCYVRPTLLVNVGVGSRLFKEETFGPVIGVVKFETDEEAVILANASRYGLGAAVFSRDIERAKKIASEIECGMVAINDFVRSDVRLPFGGTKYSGYGRELGVAGLREFVNIKVVRV
ncbi:MAG: aldehyde dehydrogenase family protein, partial [Candidatus Kapabacteria bacterium]|nr:aldehyde dehydrogenase family protein [Candidatus Kapabacteria bacterium]